jgi:hypothetical protein
MLRIFGFSILMLFAVAATLPLAESQAGGGKNSAAVRGKNSKYMTRRQWISFTRRRRAAQRRQRTLARLRAAEATKAGAANTASNVMIPASAISRPAGMPNFAAPATWSAAAARSGEMRWQVAPNNGTSAADVTLTPLGFAGTDATLNPRFRTLGGYPHADLRRQAIDRMIAEGGWVINDAERVIGGHGTFIVQAASGNPDALRHWTFYFTVADDRLYRFVSVADDKDATRLAGEIETIVATLRAPSGAPQTARKAN